jgi:hypothetical protein
MKLSHETVQTMKSPVAKTAALLFGGATLVLVFQILKRLI